MAGPHPAVAQVRLAVRQVLETARPGGLVLAACSGGADSLALAAGLAFEAPRLRLRAGAVTVDHGLQDGSAQRAAELARRLAGLGLAPVVVETVTVPGPGTPGYRGPEAAARQARYRALDAAADAAGAAIILLGHTLDDQAETVLLGLARGSGSRSLAGMPAASGRYRRPLLAVRRPVTRAACAAQQLAPWEDPHNADDRFARARVRAGALPALTAALGPGVPEALARTAQQLRADAEVLDGIAAAACDRLTGPDGALPAAELAALPAAIRTRVLHRAALAAGVPPGALTAAHIEALDALAAHWHGQRGTSLPGGISGCRRYGRLFLSARQAGGAAGPLPAAKFRPQDAMLAPQAEPRQEAAGGRWRHGP